MHKPESVPKKDIHEIGVYEFEFEFCLTAYKTLLVI